MGLDESFPPWKNVYDWIRGLKKLSDGNTARLELDVLRSGEMIVLCAQSTGTHISLGLWLESVGRRESVNIGELGTCIIEECNKEEMQRNLLPLLSRLCVYGFLGVTHKDFLKKRESQTKISQKGIEELLQLEIEPGTIEALLHKRAFNNLFRAACFSHCIKQDNEIKYPEATLKRLAAKTLKIIGLHATESLMKSLASKYTQILSEYDLGGSMDKLKFSFSPSVGNSWIIRCYCPRLEMERTIHYKEADKHLEEALSHQLLQCMLSLEHSVNIQEACIKVELKIDNLRCRALQLDSYKGIRSELENEWYFPAKISLAMGPECTSGVYDLSLGASSPNPSASVSKAKTNERGLKVEVASGMPSLSLEVSDARTTSSTHIMKNWHFVTSVPKDTQGRLEWILCDNSDGRPVFDHKPGCSKHDKAFKAFAEGVGSDRPFTLDGGVIFAGDMYGTPMTWCLSKDLRGKTLKWFVEVEIWLAYYANEYPTKYMEIRYQKFRELVELSLVQSVQDSSPQPTSGQLDQDTASHPAELQVPLNWVLVICILFYFYNHFFK